MAHDLPKKKTLHFRLSIACHIEPFLQKEKKKKNTSPLLSIEIFTKQYNVKIHRYKHKTIC